MSLYTFFVRENNYASGFAKWVGLNVCIIHNKISGMCSGGHYRGCGSGCGQLPVVWPGLTAPLPLTSSAGSPQVETVSGTAAGMSPSASARGA